MASEVRGDRVVKIACLACGKTVRIPQYIDYNRYDGQLVCQKCESLLHIIFVKGKVQKYKVVENKSKSSNWVKLVESAQEAQKQQREGMKDSSR